MFDHDSQIHFLLSYFIFRFWISIHFWTESFVFESAETRDWEALPGKSKTVSSVLGWENAYLFQHFSKLCTHAQNWELRSNTVLRAPTTETKLSNRLSFASWAALPSWALYGFTVHGPLWSKVVKLLKEWVRKNGRRAEAGKQGVARRFVT